MKPFIFIALVAASVYGVYTLLKPKEEEQDNNPQGFGDGWEDDNHMHV